MIQPAELVYFLCALTSIGCGILLFRRFLRTRSRLLLWSAVCFVFLAVNNGLLVLDLVVFRRVDLSIWRAVTGALAMAVMLFGLIWEGSDG